MTKLTKRLKSELSSLCKDARAAHPELTEEEARYLVLDEMFDDLPDGAYFAAMQDFGLTETKIIKLSESTTNKGITL